MGAANEGQTTTGGSTLREKFGYTPSTQIGFGFRLGPAPGAGQGEQAWESCVRAFTGAIARPNCVQLRFTFFSVLGNAVSNPRIRTSDLMTLRHIVQVGAD